MFKRVSNMLALSLLLACASMSAALAQESGSAAIGGSVLVTKHANKAAHAWNQGDYATARDEYTKCIGYDATNPEFYQGIAESCEKTKEYNRVVGALDKLFSIAPDKKKFYEYDYGVALYNTNNYDAAIPHLKAALATADITPPPFKPLEVRLEDLDGGSGGTTQIAPLPAGGKPTTTTTATTSSASSSNSGKVLEEDKAGVVSASTVDAMGRELMNYDNAIRSEAIVIAEYEGYEKSDAIRYNSPPKAFYHMVELLKGPPFNRAMPVRFAFHTPAASEAPPGWKFDDKTMMPAKGSKWILFIEWAVPERGQFNTYLGSYGRQEATEANLDKLDRLLESHNMKFLQK
jgi:tetratricopeptide (TPR) repeat protein